MRDVVRRGTGRRAMALGRTDLSGKTGTSNDRRDAWFGGFNADLAAIVWVGYDDDLPLGPREEGSRTALPIWIEFARIALKGVPEHQMPMPEGIVSVRSIEKRAVRRAPARRTSCSRCFARATCLTASVSTSHRSFQRCGRIDPAGRRRGRRDESSSDQSDGQKTNK